MVNFFIIIGVVILIAVACFITFKTTKVHELHKIRAAFEDREKQIRSIMETLRNDGKEETEEYYEELGALIELSKDLSELDNI